MTDIVVPSLDLNDFVSGTPEQKRDFCKNIGKAYNETGFVVIKNPGLTKQETDKLYEQVIKFFSLDEETKKRYEIPELHGQRGYTSKGKEKAKDSKVPDLKEFWQQGQPISKSEHLDEEYPENLYVEELPEFNQITVDVYKKLEKTGKILLQSLALYLDLDENYFEDKVHNGNSILRMIHYFPILNPEELSPDAVRAGAHEDINLITLLIGASAEGLQVLTRDGEWLAINANEDEIVVNVGDMLQRLTNKKLVSTTHRVVNPPRHLLGTSRYSVPFFLHPKSNMNLACLDSCISDKYPKLYDDITAGEYLDERLREIGLKM